MASIHQQTIPKSFSITEEPDENEVPDKTDFNTDQKKYEAPTGISLRVNIKIEEPSTTKNKPSPRTTTHLNPSALTTKACSKQASNSQLHSSQYTSSMHPGGSSSNSQQNSMANYASGVKIDNILNIVHNGSSSLRELQI